MIINNPNTREIVNILVIGMFVYGGFFAIILILMKYLFDYIRDVEVKLIAQTSPEHKALTRAYFYKLYNEHKKEKDYDKRLDKMFEDERSKGK